MEKIAVIALWSLVIVAGILVGASIFERVVVTPLWAGALPTSVTSWPYGAVQGRFFEVATPGWALLSLAVLALSFVMPEEARVWARVAGVIGVGTLVWTLAFFVPIVTRLEANRGAGLTPDEIAHQARQFVDWGLLRTFVALGGWLAAVRALVLASR